jgi:transketolase
VAIARRDGPTALALTRQKLPLLAGSATGAELGVGRGAYVVHETRRGEPAELLLLASGSEVALAIGAADQLALGGIAVRVVSFASWELFARQEAAYRDAVLPPGVTARLAVEAAAPFGWQRWVGERGEVFGIEGFGASAPAEALAGRFGFTVESVAERAAALLGRAFGR